MIIINKNHNIKFKKSIRSENLLLWKNNKNGWYKDFNFLQIVVKEHFHHKILRMFLETLETHKTSTHYIMKMQEKLFKIKYQIRNYFMTGFDN